MDKNVDKLELKKENQFKRVQRAVNCSRMNSSYEFCDNCNLVGSCKRDKHYYARLKEIKLL